MPPIDDVLPRLRAALRESPCAVLVAPPGAGKTTRAPLALLDEPWARGGKIVLLSPRRVAARAVAARMAQTLGERAGETVGFRVRLETCVSARTRVEVVTEGVFTRMILADPALEGVAAVLFDEFHERSLDADLGLALARDAQLGLREDLRLLVMSATLDGARVSALLDDCPVIESLGRMFPVAVRHMPRDPRAPIEEAMAEAVRRALREEAGSILCFLPGAREIERCAQRLRESLRDPATSVHPLYGALDPAEQDAAIAPAAAGRRKVVLATSIAETSLTIEGVRVVIDSGLTRRPRYEPGLGLARLETVRVSQAAAEQRKGRAGRLAPGVCWRLWGEGETRALAPFDRPEMLDADLSSLALDLAGWGVADPAALRWLDPPPAAAWAEATALLQGLGATDADGRLTAHGRALARFGLEPRLAHMALKGAQAGAGALAAQLAALLTEPGLGGRDPDLTDRLERFAREPGRRAEAARRLAQRWAREAAALSPASPAARLPASPGALLALAFPERVARARPGKPGEFLMANGRAASVEPTHAMAKAAFLVIADASGAGPAARTLAAAPIAEAEVEALFADRIEAREAVQFEAASGAVRARRTRRLGRITLSETPIAKPSPDRIGAAIVEAVRAQGLALLPWTDAAQQLRARVGLMRALEGEPWPDLGDAALLATLDDWLAPAAEGVDGRDALAARLAPAVAGLMPFALKRRLDAEAPVAFVSPAGSERPIDYTAEGGPALAIRLQELFGQDRHPTIASGRVALTLRLLSPAQRPVQTTKDLPGFWRGSYAAVKAEMKGRYPKHPWPDDPLTATPTQRAKPRGE